MSAFHFFGFDGNDTIEYPEYTTNLEFPSSAVLPGVYKYGKNQGGFVDRPKTPDYHEGIYEASAPTERTQYLTAFGVRR
jgi:hypothetical protein